MNLHSKAENYTVMGKVPPLLGGMLNTMSKMSQDSYAPLQMGKKWIYLHVG